MILTHDLAPADEFATQTEAVQADSIGTDRDGIAAGGDRITNPRILVVDDEVLTIEVIQGHLQHDGYRQIVGIDNPATALWNAISESPDVVLLDLRMPQINGIDFLKEMRRDQRTAHVPVMMLTASTDHDEKLKALEAGATDFLHKPISGDELRARLRNILMAKAYQDHLQNHSAILEAAIRRRTAELECSRREVIHCLARAAEFRDEATGQHVLRVGRYARIIGAKLDLDEETLDMLEQTAQLHDIGKIGIPDTILLKPAKLTAEETDLMRKHCNFGKQVVQPMPTAPSELQQQHTEIGARILDAGQSPLLKLAMRIALTHHEWWDGTGYPLGLAGEDIPLEGRITAVADVFDALSTKRPYKAALPLDECFAIMKESRGKQFEPRILDAFMNCREQIVQTQIEFAECQ